MNDMNELMKTVHDRWQHSGSTCAWHMSTTITRVNSILHWGNPRDMSCGYSTSSVPASLVVVVSSMCYLIVVSVSVSSVSLVSPSLICVYSSSTSSDCESNAVKAVKQPSTTIQSPSDRPKYYFSIPDEAYDRSPQFFPPRVLPPNPPKFPKTTQTIPIMSLTSKLVFSVLYSVLNSRMHAYYTMLALTRLHYAL